MSGHKLSRSVLLAPERPFFGCRAPQDLAAFSVQTVRCGAVRLAGDWRPCRACESTWLARTAPLPSLPRAALEAKTKAEPLLLLFGFFSICMLLAARGSRRMDILAPREARCEAKHDQAHAEALGWVP